jgi:hypothetical protein
MASINSNNNVNMGSSNCPHSKKKNNDAGKIAGIVCGSVAGTAALGIGGKLIWDQFQKTKAAKAAEEEAAKGSVLGSAGEVLKGVFPEGAKSLLKPALKVGGVGLGLGALALAWKAFTHDAEAEGESFASKMFGKVLGRDSHPGAEGHYDEFQE